MKLLHLLFAGGMAVGSPATARELVTPPATPHPLPQGVPVHGLAPHSVITLRYAIVDGRRVLYDPDTNRVVYVLRP
ncbi:MAG TPA: hypothetical protein VGA77_13235 [Propylenella sp.]